MCKMLNILKISVKIKKQIESRFQNMMVQTKGCHVGLFKFSKLTFWGFEPPIFTLLSRYHNHYTTEHRAYICENKFNILKMWFKVKISNIKHVSEHEIHNNMLLYLIFSNFKIDFLGI